MRGEQFTPAYLETSPNNKIPAIVDHAPRYGGAPMSMFESGAILIYLAEKARALLPEEPCRNEVFAWLMWQMAGQGPMLGQAGHFRNYAPEPIPYAVRRYSEEAVRLYRVLDTRLAGRDYVAGDYSIADIACWPWILFGTHHGITLADYSNVARWWSAIRGRPAVARAIPDFDPPPPIIPDQVARRILFNIRE